MSDPKINIKVTAENETARSLSEAGQQIAGFGQSAEHNFETIRESSESTSSGFGRLADDSRDALSRMDDLIRETSDDARDALLGIQDAAEPVAESLDDVGESSEKTRGGFEKLGDTAKTAIGVGVGIIAAQAIVAVGAAMKDSIRIGYETEREMALIAIAMDLTTEASDELAQGFRGIAGEVGGSVATYQNLTRAYSSIRNEGLSTGEALDIMRNAARLSTLSGNELGVSVKGIADTLDIFQLSAGEAGNVTNALWAAYKHGEANIPQLVEAINSQGAAMHTANIPMGEAIALTAVLQDAGVKNISGAVEAYGDMRNATDAGRLALEAHNVRVVDSGGKLRLFVDILRDAERSSMDSKDALAAFGIRGGVAIDAITSRGPLFQATLNGMTTATDEMAAAQQRYETGNAARAQEFIAWWQKKKEATGAWAMDSIDWMGRVQDKWVYLTTPFNTEIATWNWWTRFAAGATTGADAQERATDASSDFAIVVTAGTEQLDAHVKSYEAFTSALNASANAERTFAAEADETRQKLDAQEVVTRKKGETTEDFRARIAAAGEAEAAAAMIFDDTTQSIQLQADGTYVLIDGLSKAQDELEKSGGKLSNYRGSVNAVVDALGTWRSVEEAIRNQQVARETMQNGNAAVLDFQNGWRGIIQGDGSLTLSNPNVQGGENFRNTSNSGAAGIMGLTQEAFEALLRAAIVRAQSGAQAGGGGGSAPPPPQPPPYPSDAQAIGTAPNGATVLVNAAQAFMWRESDRHFSSADRGNETEWLAGRRLPFAKGGMTQGAVNALLGDNPSGREAVLPLDSPVTISVLADALEAAMGRGGGRSSGAPTVIIINNTQDADRVLRAYGLNRRMLG